MSFRQPEREGAFPSRSPPLDAPIIEAEGCGAWGWPAYLGQDASGNVLVQARRWQLPQQPPDRYRGIGGRVCWLFILQDTEPSPLQDSFSVRQQGGLPGPPPRSP